MHLNEIKAYLVSHHLLNDPEVSLLGSGEANLSYLAKDNTQQYVVRIARNDTPEQSRLEAEHHFMLFIESLGIPFAPRSIHYDAAHEIHIISYIEGNDISVADLNRAQTAVFIDQLQILDSITYDQYTDWCEQHQYTPRPPQTLAQRNQINITNRLQTIRNFANTDPFAREILDWAEPKVTMLSRIEQEADVLKTRFLHNDLRWNEGGGNIRATHSGLAFIDWELSGFYESAAPEIGDILGSIPSTVSKAIPRNLHQTYTANEDDAEQQNKAIQYGVLWGKLGNPLWAAERYFIFSKKNHPEAERYKNTAKQGIVDAQGFFEMPFDRWFQ